MQSILGIPTPCSFFGYFSVIIEDKKRVIIEFKLLNQFHNLIRFSLIVTVIIICSNGSPHLDREATPLQYLHRDIPSSKRNRGEKTLKSDCLIGRKDKFHRSGI